MPNPEVNLFIITSLESKQLVEPKDKNLKRNQIYFSDKQFSDGASDSRNKASWRSNKTKVDKGHISWLESAALLLELLESRRCPAVIIDKN